MVVQIADTGVGIRPEDIGRIFDPGFTTRGVKVGTGLGLAICHQIVKDHNRKIEVKSEVGAGTTVTISLLILETNKGFSGRSFQPVVLC